MAGCISQAVGGGQKIALRAGLCLPIPVCKKSRGCCPTASNPYWYNDKKSPFLKNLGLVENGFPPKNFSRSGPPENGFSRNAYFLMPKIKMSVCCSFNTKVYSVSPSFGYGRFPQSMALQLCLATTPHDTQYSSLTVVCPTNVVFSRTT